MKIAWLLLTIFLAWLPFEGRAAARDPSPDEIILNVLESDPWGLTRGKVKASAVLTDKRGTKRELAFEAASRRHDPPLSKSIVRFSAPPDLAGAGFLQIQNRNGDDDRFLFLPALKRSRRIAGNLRGSSFMGTDFSFADLDRRDLRDSQARQIGTEKVGSATCFVLDVLPRRGDSQYSHMELWVRADNFLTLRSRMYDKANVLIKTFEARELRRVDGNWFITRSIMRDLKHDHTTVLTLQSIVVDAEIPDEEFTQRALEKP
ncbi:MAG TPA: outer membrane lipoprotein-sorting protein [Polyangiaceae bacterium]|nr:outer membrane lipoprotein-sorting protein [Polyangiaceae bacterium]